MRSLQALPLLLGGLVLCASLPTRRPASTPSKRNGSLAVELVIPAWPVRDTSIFVYLLDSNKHARRARSDRRGIAFFPNLRADTVWIWTPEGHSDTIRVAVAAGDTTRQVLYTKLRGHIPGTWSN